MTIYDEPEELSAAVAGRPRPLLIGLDIDGVLSPIVGHADDAVLLDGVGDAVTAVAAHPTVDVAAISGRSLAGIAQFGFGEDIHVIGSHGMEPRDGTMTDLDDIEAARLHQLDALVRAAAGRAGDGAWVESKPASVVLHVKQADPTSGATALAELRIAASEIDGAIVKPGSAVLELLTRSADKGTAMRQLAQRLGARTLVFVGDDVTDEDAFAVIGETGVTIKVGDGDTLARHRLHGPADVRTWLQRLDGHLTD